MKYLIAALTVIAVFAGCDRADHADSAQAETSSSPASVEASAPAVPVITKDSPIWFEPESLSTCPGAAPTTGVVHWNASSFPGVVTVQLTMPAEGKPDGMFTIAGTVGQKETGPWLAAGTEFVLRDNANGAELARAKMPGAPCNE